MINDHKEQARLLHEELKRKGGDIETTQRFADFLARYEGSDKIVESTALAGKIKDLEAEDRYYTGITKLDDILDGFRSNQLIVIGSAPKSGKTQLSVELARRINMQGKTKATMFLFEETAEEVLYKYHKKGLPLPSFLTPQDLIDYNIDSLYRKMIEAWAKYDSRVFFIDLRDEVAISSFHLWVRRRKRTYIFCSKNSAICSKKSQDSSQCGGVELDSKSSIYV